MKGYNVNRIFALSIIVGVLLVVGFWIYNTEANNEPRVVEVEIGGGDDGKGEGAISPNAVVNDDVLVKGRFGVQDPTTPGVNPLNLIVLDSGVGIGNTSPQARLHVSGSAGLLVDGAGGSGFADIRAGDNFDYRITSDNNPAGLHIYRKSTGIGDFVLDRNGNLGIGRLSPEAKLHVSQAMAGEFAAIIRNTDSSGHGVLIDAASGTTDALLIRDFASQALFEVNGNGNVGIGTGSPTNPLEVKLNQSGGGANAPIKFGDSLGFAYLGIGAGSQYIYFADEGGVERFVIRQENGFVGIGETSPSEKLHVNGKALAEEHTTFSSRRWKTNIEPIEGALDMVQRLRGVSYDWKASGKHDIGLIAEEVGEVVPEVVVYEENGVDAKSVAYARLVAVLIEAVKEQQQVIERQNSELAEVKAENAKVEQKIAGIESTLQRLEALVAVGNNDATATEEWGFGTH